MSNIPLFSVRTLPYYTHTRDSELRLEKLVVSQVTPPSFVDVSPREISLLVLLLLLLLLLYEFSLHLDYFLMK